MTVKSLREVLSRDNEICFQYFLRIKSVHFKSDIPREQVPDFGSKTRVSSLPMSAVTSESQPNGQILLNHHGTRVSLLPLEHSSGDIREQ